MKLTNEEIDFLISMTQWLFDDGFANFTHEDWKKFKKIKKKWKNNYEM